MINRQTMAAALPRALWERLQGLQALAIAFSGGLDSRFLCHAARLCACKILAIHISGPHVASRDSEKARSWAERNDIDFISIPMNPLEVEGLRDNSRERCYFCKKSAFGKIRALALEKGLHNYHLCDGGNRDDKREYRPGLRAVQELGFISPLSDAGLGKMEIRRHARLTGMEDPEQRARPCLLTRFPYGHVPGLEKLAVLERTEGQIEDMLSDCGHANIDFRLRMSASPELHINPLPQDLLAKIRHILENNSFANCQIIQMEEISGYYDKGAIKNGRK